MAIQAALHDGRILEFPDGTDPSVVQATVKRVLGVSAPEEKPVPAQQAAPVVEEKPVPVPAPAPVEQPAAAPAQQAAPAPAKPDDLEARLAAQEAKQKEFSFAQELGKGAKGAFEFGLPSMAEQVKLQGSSDAFLASQKRLELMNKIDSGAYKNFDEVKSDPLYQALRDSGQNLALVNTYYGSRNTPDVAAKLRGRVKKDFDEMASSAGTSIDLLNKYARENKKKYGPRVEKFTDINWTDPQVVADFTNYMGYNMGAAGVQLAPIMVAAIVAKKPAVLTLSSAMETAGAIQNRMEFIQKKVKDLPPEQQNAAISKYIAETGDTNLMLGVISGSFDMLLGPAATAAKMTSKQLLEQLSKKGAAKAAAKELPKDILQEAGTGALQETTQIAGKKALGEETKRITGQNIKDVVNASAAEGFGAPVGTSINVARAAYAAPGVPKEEAGPTTQDYEDLAKSKGFLRPTTKAETDLGGMGAVRPGQDLKTPTPPVNQNVAPPVAQPVAQENAPPVAPVEEELKAKAEEDAATEELIKTSGLTESQARRIVKAKTRRETERTKPKSVVTDITNAVPAKIPTWPDAALQQTLDLQMNKPEATRNTPLVEAILMEIEKRAATQGETQGETNVRQPDGAPSGTSTEVAGAANQGIPAARVGEDQRSGVVSTEQNAISPDGRETGKPVAVKPQLPVAQAGEPAMQVQDGTRQPVPMSALTTPEALQRAGQVLSVPDKTPENIVRELNFANSRGGLATWEIETILGLRDQNQPKVKGQVGRPPMYTPEKKAEVKQTKAPVNALKGEVTRAVNSATKQFDALPEKIAKGEVNPDELRVKRRETIKNLLRLQQELKDIGELNSEPGKRLKAALQHQNIKPQEVADLQRGIDLVRNVSKPLSNRASVGKADIGFSKATNAAQALTQVMKTGNAFQKLLAARLRPFVGKVKFVVVERSDPTPEALQSGVNAEAWERARGVFIQNDKTGEKTVYVRGTSFSADQGVNNITVLHEILHAATNQKIILGMIAGQRGFDRNAKITKLVEELNALMVNASVFYEVAKEQGKIPPRLQALIEATESVDEQTGEVGYGIFELPQEFLAYGMSDPDFQSFLAALPGKRESGFSRFVRAILNAFGLADDDFTALTDLVDISDQLLSAQKTSTMKLVEEGIPSMPSESRKQNRNDRELRKEWNRAKQVYEKSAMSTKFKNRGIKQKAIERMNPQELMDWVKSYWPVATKAQREVMARLPSIEFLGVLASDAARDSKPPIDTIPGAPKGARYGKYDEGKGWRLLDVNGKTIEHVKGTDFPYITQAADLMTKMVGTQKVLAENTERLIYQLKKAFKGDPALIDKVSELLYVTSNAEVNPSDPNATERIAEADQMYADLGKEGQALYKAVIGHYENRGDLYLQLLEDNLSQMGIDPEQKKNALLVLRKVYEAENRIEPYVAFVRDEGDYWLSIGKGENKEFYIYESMVDRDADRKRMMAERNLSNDDVKSGDSLNDLRQQAYESSALLREMFKAIDSTPQKEGDTDKSFADYKESLKDAVYQGYLSVMPERSFRGMFKHRKGLAGYRTDLIQNIATTDGKMNTQLARLEYGQQIRNVVDSAKETTKDRRDMQPFVDELSRRVDNFLSPAPHNYMDEVAGIAGRVGFIYMLGGFSLPLLQPLALVSSALPILWGNYKSNPVEVGAQLVGALLNLPSYGVTTTMPDGSTRYQWPSLVNTNENQLGNVAPLDADEERAMKEFGQSGVHESTLARSVWDHAGKPTSSFIKEEGKEVEYYASRTMQGIDTVVGSPFHIMERWTREALFLAAYRLGRNKNNNLTHEQAVTKALANVKEALGDYDTHAKPRWMQRGAGKMMFALKTFMVLITSQTIGNLYKAIPGLNKEGKKEAIKKFSGIMVTMGLLAGASGVPLATVFYHFAASLVMALGDDDDDSEEELELKNIDKGLWFRSVYLPRVIPNIEIGGVKLYDWIDRGILNGITGWDFASRLQVATTFGQETPKPAKTTMEAVLYLAKDYFAGAYFGLLEQWFNSYDAYQLGDTQRAKELAAPKPWKDIEKSIRYSEEGVKFAGKQVIEPGDLSKLLIWGQALGFTPDIVSTIQKEGTKIAAAKESIRIQREALLNKLDIADRKDSDEGDAEFDRIMDTEVEKFNEKFPSYELTDDSIQRSLDAKQEARDNAIAGVTVDTKDEDAFGALLDKMEERIERNAAKMEKKREASGQLQRK
jgi:hypothetical protein